MLKSILKFYFTWEGYTISVVAGGISAGVVSAVVQPFTKPVPEAFPKTLTTRVIERSSSIVVNYGLGFLGGAMVVGTLPLTGPVLAYTYLEGKLKN